MKLRTIVIIVVVVVILLLLKFVFFPGKTEEKPAGMQGKQGSANISAYIVSAEKLSNDVFASGTVTANEQVSLQPELAGKVIQINFTEGSAVSKGQLLVKINDAELQAQYRKLKLQHALSEERMGRLEKLLAINGVSQEEFDIARNEADVIKAEMEYSSAQIAKTEIRAPFSGIVGLKSISEGAFVAPGTVIATIQQIRPLKIDFSISERYSDLVRKGDKVLFSREGDAKKFQAEVYAIEPRIDMETRSLQIRALCADGQDQVFPGAFVRVQLALGDIDSATMVPTEAIVPVLKGQKVYRIRGGKAESVPVETGLRTDKKIQVTSGLNSGDTVAVTGVMQLRDGAAVKISAFKK